MVITHKFFIITLCIMVLPASAGARQDSVVKVDKQANKQADKQAAKKPAKIAPREVDPMLEVRRATAISLINSLADEARSFHEPTLRARVQARSADALWLTDKDRARALFRRAWEAAAAADDENERRVEEERRKQTAERGSFSIQLPPSLRSEVLRLAARRDRTLGEEFLTQLEEKRKEEADALTSGAEKDAAAKSGEAASRGAEALEASPTVAKRLELARQLLDDGDVERAIQFADPALAGVNIPAIYFLSQLRTKNAAAADERYAALLARAAGDPAADANTVSVLSSYIFTPGLFVRFDPDSGSNTSQFNSPLPAPTDMPAPLRASFLRAGAAILLRPIPLAELDHSSAGRAGWYLVIARLLPLFDRYAPGNAAALRTQLGALTPDTPQDARQPGNNNAVTRGIVPEDASRDRVQDSLNRLDRAKSDDERDAIYADVVLDALRRKDSRVDEFIGKISDIELRQRLRAYVDYERVRAALESKDVSEVLRITRGGGLPPLQRAWALTEVAKLVAKAEPGRATELLEEATTETKRIDAASPDRVRALVAVATQLIGLDRARTWEVMNEIVKASNAAADFSGEDGALSVRLQTKFSASRMSNSVDSFDLHGIFEALAKEDLNRAVELARSFNGESPRAVATLAIARAVLDKK